MRPSVRIEHERENTENTGSPAKALASWWVCKKSKRRKSSYKRPDVFVKKDTRTLTILPWCFESALKRFGNARMSCCVRLTVENLLKKFQGFCIPFGVVISWLHTKNTWEKSSIINNVNKVSAHHSFVLYYDKRSLTRPPPPPVHHSFVWYSVKKGFHAFTLFHCSIPVEGSEDNMASEGF